MGGLLGVDDCGWFSVEKNVRKGNEQSYAVRDEKAMWIAMWKMIKKGVEGSRK